MLQVASLNGHLSDACVDITFSASTSKKEVSAAMGALKDGVYLDKKWGVCMKTHAFVLLPKEKTEGRMSVGGDPAEFAPIALQVHSAKLNVLANPRWLTPIK